MIIAVDTCFAKFHFVTGEKMKKRGGGKNRIY